MEDIYIYILYIYDAPSSAPAEAPYPRILEQEFVLQSPQMMTIQNHDVSIRIRYTPIPSIKIAGCALFVAPAVHAPGSNVLAINASGLADLCP